MSQLTEKHPVDIHEYRCSLCHGVLWLPSAVDVLFCYLCQPDLNGIMRRVSRIRIHKASDVIPEIRSPQAS